jgi:hypothetical protein
VYQLFDNAKEIGLYDPVTCTSTPTYATLFEREVVMEDLTTKEFSQPSVPCVFRFDEEGKQFRVDTLPSRTVSYHAGQPVILENSKLHFPTSDASDLVLDLRVDQVVQDETNVDVYLNKHVIVVTDTMNDRLKVFHYTSLKFLHFIHVKKPCRILFVGLHDLRSSSSSSENSLAVKREMLVHVISKNNETLHYQIHSAPSHGSKRSRLLLNWPIPTSSGTLNPQDITSDGSQIFVVNDQNTLSIYTISYEPIPDPKVRMIQSSASSSSSSAPPPSVWKRQVDRL